MLGVPVGVYRYPYTQNRVGIKGDMGGLRLKIGRIKVWGWRVDGAAGTATAID